MQLRITGQPLDDRTRILSSLDQENALLRVTLVACKRIREGIDVRLLSVLLLVISLFVLGLQLARAQNQAPQPTTQPPSEEERGGLALPENGYLLSNVSEVAQAIATANQELMVAADVLRSQEIADALRIAMVQRGVPVYILAPLETAQDPASYFASLALAGANLRTGAVSSSFISVDRQVIVAGSLVAGVQALPGFEEADPSLLVNDASYAAYFVESFYASFQSANPFDLNQLATEEVQ